jgi:thioredoxin reductase
MDGRQYDVVVVGGGPAGLQAALTLGRMHREVLLLDSGRYRNDAAHALHNFASHDGRPPAEFRAGARHDLQAYDTVAVREAVATEITAESAGWRVAVAGAAPVVARKIVLATGLRDTLPDKPGLADLWGDVVAHCPYCHGHEFSGRPVAVLGSGPHVAKLASLVARIASRITVLADGDEVDAETAQALGRAGIAVRTERVVGVRRSGAGATVGFESAPDEEVAGLFVTTALSQSAPFPEQLGLELLTSGCVRVDEFGRTSRPGVYAAGDMAHVASLPMPLASVLTAAASGLLAATAADMDLLADESGLVRAA